MDPESDQHQGSLLVFFVGSQRLQEPFSLIPYSCPPSQGSLLLAYNGVCSLLTCMTIPFLGSLFFIALLCSAMWTFIVLPVSPTLVAEYSAQGIECTMPFTSIMPGRSFTFVRNFQRVYTQWSTCFADLLPDAFDIWQKHSGPWVGCFKKQKRRRDVLQSGRLRAREFLPYIKGISEKTPSGNWAYNMFCNKPSIRRASSLAP